MDSFFELNIYINGGLFGVKRGNTVLCEAQYDSIELYGDYAIVTSGDNKGVLDSRGVFCIPLSRCSILFLLGNIVFVDSKKHSFVFNLASSKKLFCQKAERKDDVLIIDNKTIVDETLTELLSFNESEWSFDALGNGLLYFYGKGDKFRAYYKNYLIAEWTGDRSGLEACKEGFTFYDGYLEHYTKVIALSGNVLIDVSSKPRNNDWTRLSDIPIRGLRLYNRGDCCGIEDYSGVSFLSPEYDKIWPCGYKYFIAKKGSNHIILNEYLNPLAELDFKRVFEHKSIFNKRCFVSDLIEVRNGNHYGLVDIWGRVRIPCDYDELRFLTEDIVEVAKGERHGYLDIFGNVLLSMDFESTEVAYAGEFGDEYDYALFKNNTLCRIRKGGKWGAINRRAEIVLECEYDDYCDCYNSWVIAFKKGDKWTVFDHEGKAILKNLDSVSGFSDGRCCVLKDNRFGYIREDGKLLEPGFVYLDAEHYKNGRARIQKEDLLYYLIDKEGVVCSAGYEKISRAGGNDSFIISIKGRSYYMDANGNTTVPTEEPSSTLKKKFSSSILSIPRISTSAYTSFFDFVYGGKSIDTIADNRRLTRGTIVNHLIPFIVAGIDRELYSDSDLVSNRSFSSVRSYLKINPNCKSLKEIYTFLLEGVSYDEIRLSIALLLRDDEYYSKTSILRQYSDIQQELQEENESDEVDDYDDFNDYDDYSSWSYEESLAEACDGCYDAMLELMDRG